MIKITAPGLVIREQSVGEFDRLITVLTADYGLVRAFSRGAKKTKSRKLSATSLLTYSDFTFTKSRDAFAVEEAAVKEVFFELREDVIKLSLAQYFCELGYEFCEEDYESEEILRLFLNSLYFLKSNKKEPAFIKAVAELRLVSLAGYMPALMGCDSCGEYTTPVMKFVPESGKLYCENCVADGVFINISAPVVEAIRHIVLSDFEKIFSFSLSSDKLKELSEVSEKYLLSKTQRRFKTLDFYNTIKD